jgi:hypothetical protein
LFDFLKQELSNLDVCLSNFCGQGYNISANMVGYKQGVLARILNENPRTLFLLYCAHSLNILFGKFFSYYTFFIFYINNM